MFSTTQAVPLPFSSTWMANAALAMTMFFCAWRAVPWSNYSWLVGDIFGAPLAIEGIVAFFLEATFVGVMFFGWERVSTGFHLASTWLTGLGATISAWWILVANAWMQYPVGQAFNLDTMRNEMTSFNSSKFLVSINSFMNQT